MLNLLIEALVVGIVFTVVILILHAIVEMGILSSEKPSSHTDYMPRIAILGFFSAIITHFLFELSGANKWYCKNGVACKLN